MTRSSPCPQGRALAAAALLFLSPAAALAGLPQPLPAEAHPSLLFDAAAVPELRQRVQREPYASW